MIQDVLTIRADRDRYYYGVSDLFHLQPDVVENILHEAPQLAETFLDGLIWRSHKTQDGLRPVIYYLEHLVQDPDENKMISRALKSLIRFNHPITIMHPILTFTLDLLWIRLARRFFVTDRLLTLINFLIFILAGCYLNHLQTGDDIPKILLAVARVLVYTLGFGKLLYAHTLHIYKSFLNGNFKKVWGVDVPQHLTEGPELLSFILMLDMVAELFKFLLWNSGFFDGSVFPQRAGN